MKKALSVALSLLLILSINMTVFASEEQDSRTMTLEEYCSSSNYSIEGLKELYPEYYKTCHSKYIQDLALIDEINRNIDDMVEYGQRIAASDAKSSLPVTRGSSLGTYGDILVSLQIDSGSFGFAGHAAIVANNQNYTYESYAQSFSPINVDGVSVYSNTWGNRSGSLLVRPYGATSTQYTTATSFAAGKVGLPYNWVFTNKTRTDKYYCSQLVWQAWLQAGINTETGSIPNAIIAPADLVNSSNTYVVTHIT